MVRHLELGRFVVSLACMFTGAGFAGAWELGGPLYTSRYPVPPSFYGYPLNDPGGYSGSYNAKEYYNFGRGSWLAGFPGPLPYYPGCWQGYAYHNDPTRGYPSYPGFEAIAPGDAPGIVPTPPPDDDVAIFVVKVPEHAQVWLQNLKTKKTGTSRSFISTPLATGAEYSYEIRARWQENGHDIEQTQILVVRAGNRPTVLFPAKGAEGVLPEPKKLPIDLGK